MPCYQGPTPESERQAERAVRHADAMTALLCGVDPSNPNPVAVALAAEWRVHHKAVDWLRENGTGERWPLTQAEERCRLVLDRAYDALCSPTNSSGNSMDRKEWLRRYRARLVERRPSLTSEELDELANIEAHEALSAEYPDNPEKAVDDEAEESPAGAKEGG